jgi:hypothetical protein
MLVVAGNPESKDLDCAREKRLVLKGGEGSFSVYQFGCKTI